MARKTYNRLREIVRKEVDSNIQSGSYMLSNSKNVGMLRTSVTSAQITDRQTAENKLAKLELDENNSRTQANLKEAED